MEILHVAGLYPPHLGGEELAAQALACAQAASGHQVSVYTSAIGMAGGAGTTVEDGVTIHRLRARSVGHSPVMNLIGPLSRHQPTPDVVHLHSGHAGAAEQVRVACRMRRIPYVVHVHLLVRPSSSAGIVLLPLYQRLLMGGLLRSAAGIACLTSVMKDDLVSRYELDPTRVSVVANAAHVPIRPTKRHFDGHGSRLLFAGRLTAQKNVRPLVEAMERLPDVHLRLVGDGDQETTLREIVARRSLSNVEFLGRLSPADVVAQYEWADALVMPSTHEGMPLVLLESLASGLPVLAADIPELREAGADAVELLADCSAPAIADAVRKLLADSALRARLSATGQAKYADRRWEHVARDVDAVYSRARHALV